MTIRSVAVLGAGTMGAQIAAHVANAGVPVLLLDLTADVARKGLERARTMRPDPFFTADAVSLITVGGFDQDFKKLSSVDWIMEAVVEQTDIKRPLLQSVDGVRRRGRSSRRTRPAFRSHLSPRDARTTSGGTGSGRISSTRRGTSTSSR